MLQPADKKDQSLLSRALRYFWWRFSRTSPYRLILKIFYNVTAFFLLLILLPLRSKIRLADVWVPQRIGHLVRVLEALDFDINKSNKHIAQGLDIYIPLFEGNIANKALLNLFKDKLRIRIFPQPLYPVYRIIRSKKGIYKLISDIWIETVFVVPGTPQQAYAINASKTKYQSSYQLPEEWRVQRMKMFRELGMNNDQKYVCIQARDNTYIPGEKSISSTRNMDINDFKTACKYLESKNIFVVRLGNPGMHAVEEKVSLFDYANSNYKSEEMDIALAADALFFVCSPSGIAELGKLFSRPVVTVNAQPYHQPLYGSVDDLTIYKNLLIANLPNESLEYCSLDQFPFSKFLWFYDSDYLKNFSQFKITNNTPEEIMEVVAEMYLKLAGDWTESNENLRRQEKFKDFIDKASFSSKFSKSRLGARFLEAYFDRLFP